MSGDRGGIDSSPRVSAGQQGEREIRPGLDAGSEDDFCWICGGLTSKRHCKIVCQRCGFMRDCSDP